MDRTAVSHRLQSLAQEIQDALTEAAGEPCAFALLVFTGNDAQYVGNAPRPTVAIALKEMIERWEAGAPNIPYHHKQ